MSLAFCYMLTETELETPSWAGRGADKRNERRRRAIKSFDGRSLRQATFCPPRERSPRSETTAQARRRSLASALRAAAACCKTADSTEIFHEISMP